MTVRLTAARAPWDTHVQAVATAYGPGLVPVVKGNGYGFGRLSLHEVVHGLHPNPAANLVCIGTVHELHDVPGALTPVVLTPALAPPPLRANASAAAPILTVGSVAHVQALAGWQGQVLVKLASSMRRYGASPAEVDEVCDAARAAGLEIVGHGLHLPLAGHDTDRIAEIEAWLPHLADDVPLWVSHLEPEAFAALRDAHRGRTFRIRVGTALWHGVPRRPFLHLTADVLNTQPVHAGQHAGYFHSKVPHDGTLVAIGGGTSHGIALLDDTDPARRSPFHFARHRLPLLERPHMHTTVALVPHGQPCPQVGDRVDVQRPLITTAVDEVEWV
jgi:alanine racemase